MKSENRLYLKVPAYDELWYRKQLLGDPKTMEFNKGYDLYDESYNYNNGTYDFDERYWDEWYNKWGLGKGNKFYAYIVRKFDDRYIGEIAFDINNDKGDMNLIIEASARGFNYSKDALDLITKEAFENKGIEFLTDIIPESKKHIYNVYKNYGFKTYETGSKIKKFGLEENLFEMSYSKDEYFSHNKPKKLFGFFVKK